LFPIYCRIPKLDVAGSIPVSRSKFSITWLESLEILEPVNGAKQMLLASTLLILKNIPDLNANRSLLHTPRCSDLVLYSS